MRNHDADLAAGNQFKSLSKLCDGGCEGADDLQFFENHQAGVEGGLSANNVAEDEQAATALEGVQTFVERGAPYNFESDIYRSYQLFNCFRKFQPGRMNDGMGAPLFEALELRFGAGHCNHPRPHETSQLHGVNAHTATGTGDENCLAGFEPRAATKRVHGGA